MSRLLSDDQIDEAAALRERGWSCERIAAHFASLGTHASPQVVNWHCLRVGADTPPRMWSQRARPSAEPIARNGHIVRHFTPEEDARLLAMDHRGDTPAQMARALGRKHNSIMGRLYTLARHQARDEIRAGVEQ